MTARQKTWVYSPPKPKVPANVKAKVEQQAQELIETVLKPRHIKPPPEELRFNYIVDIYARWYRHYFHFCAKYASPGPYALSPFFETKFARLEYKGGEGHFGLAYMRHNGQWVEIYPDLSLQECLETIKNDSFFHP